MTPTTFPSREEITICFGHVAYQLAEAFARRDLGINHFQVWSADELKERAGEADVVVASGLWSNDLLDSAPGIKFVQSASAGMDKFDADKFRANSVRLASGQGANERAVAEHAMALILSLTRRIPEACANQNAKTWRGMISDPNAREDELGGKTMLIVGMGRIGSRLATLAKVFDIHVVAVKRDPSKGGDAAHEVHAQAKLLELLPEADIVALTCPLTPETENLIGSDAFAAMKPSAHLINVARGKVVDEPALISALQGGQIAGAGIDCTVEEPLPENSPLWSIENALITPHTAGETRRYEDNVVDILMDNLERLWRGDAKLTNQVV
ncbi:MAG: D-2-hydroxyacid dehydrogenase [Hyphomicrobiaceae bacterium]|nr:D-2-hydroxyacid dehydrogenase [Hyphomicrobiaceae bacterium]